MSFLAILLAQNPNPSVPGAPRILPDCAVQGCRTLESVLDLFGNIAAVILGVIGSVMLVIFVYGGILYLTSGGESAQIQKAQKVITGALWGLAFIFGAYTVITYGASALKGENDYLNTSGTYAVCDREGSVGTACGPNSTCVNAPNGDPVCVENNSDAYQQFVEEQASAEAAAGIGSGPSTLENMTENESATIIDALEALQNEE
ncbi:hypothetical protein HYV72_00520 [Candidatus Uhrbacteria bacterium]|nr:hypothetical protein [Candidatus Uhrbacteria bacterium]